MNVSDSIRQALAAGAIASLTIQQIKQAAGKNDSRALRILQDAIGDGTVTVS